MPANPQLQARTGRNSPAAGLLPVFKSLLGFFKKLSAAVAPGVDIKLADGVDGFLFASGVDFFMGANAGAAELTLTVTVRRDSDGMVFSSDSTTLGPGPNTDGGANLFPFVYEGFSVWVNVTLTAGVYGNDAVAMAGTLSEIDQVPLRPLNITTALIEIVKAAEGHTVLLETEGPPIFLLNQDSVDHNFELYLSNELGDTLVAVGLVFAGQATTLGGPPLILNGGESIKIKLLEAVVTPNSVICLGAFTESNQFNNT